MDPTQNDRHTWAAGQQLEQGTFHSAMPYKTELCKVRFLIKGGDDNRWKDRKAQNQVIIRHEELGKESTDESYPVIWGRVGHKTGIFTTDRQTAAWPQWNWAAISGGTQMSWYVLSKNNETRERGEKTRLPIQYSILYV